MGRKIPGKKHRGIKDPFQQNAKRQAELETRINAPPRDVNEQAIPKSLERVVKLKEAVKSGKISAVKKTRRRKKKSLICVGAEHPKPAHPKGKPEKVVPVFQQRPGETPNHFMYRVGRATNAFLNEVAFEKKYGVDVVRNPETRRVESVTKCHKTELDNIEMLRAKHKNIKKKKKEGEAPRMSKGQKRKEKLKEKKKQKEEEDVDEFESFKDQVKFGEVAHEPPQLNARPKKADSTSTAKPGKKNLLLHSLLKKNVMENEGSAKTHSIDRAGKRKNLPVGERRQLEKQQNEAIAAYRRLKAQRSAEPDS